MSIEIKVPSLPESVSDATVAAWRKKEGEAVKRDETLLELETDKVMLEVPALQDGVLEKILKPAGSTVTAQEVLALIVPTDAASAPAASVSASSESASASSPAPVSSASEPVVGPGARRLLSEQSLDSSQVTGSGKGGRVTRQDVLSHMAAPASSSKAEVSVSIPVNAGREDKRVPMSRLRARIAERLLEAQHNAAMLTTFNEVNMQGVMDLRARYKDTFEKVHGVKLGMMSFFVKAVIEALKKFPAVNASIDGQEVVYHNYYDIGIAVSTPRGLVVPVLRDADALSMAEIERQIVTYAEKARDGKLTLEEMTGGTFTITNGGVFGSMLSTPILNQPQSAILGMHNIVKRPIVENDQIVIRPIMYLALSYDHRLIDGRESVSFLVTVKQLLEDPSRLVLGV